MIIIHAHPQENELPEFVLFSCKGSMTLAFIGIRRFVRLREDDCRLLERARSCAPPLLDAACAMDASILPGLHSSDRIDSYNSPHADRALRRSSILNDSSIVVSRLDPNHRYADLSHVRNSFQ